MNVNFKVKAKSKKTELWPYTITYDGPSVHGQLQARSERDAFLRVRALAENFEKRIQFGQKLT